MMTATAQVAPIGPGWPPMIRSSSGGISSRSSASRLSQERPGRRWPDVDASRSDATEEPHEDDEEDGGGDRDGPEVVADGGARTSEQVGGEHQPEEDGQPERVGDVQLPPARADASPDEHGGHRRGQDD